MTYVKVTGYLEVEEYELMEDGKVDPGSILVVGFSRKGWAAADEIVLSELADGQIEVDDR